MAADYDKRSSYLPVFRNIATKHEIEYDKSAESRADTDENTH